MFIDITFFVLILLSVFKGYRNGFVVAIFSLLAIFIGLAAAVKLSAYVAAWLSAHTSTHAAWLPIASFIGVMIVVILLVRLGAIFINATLNMVMLGWLNKISGIVLYALLYITFFSVLLFYAEKIHWLKPEAVADSHTYRFIKPCGPYSIEILGKVLPFFKGMFAVLTHFFDKI
jgi:membrane protein required for colicin V production